MESVARDRCGYPDFFRVRDLFDNSFAEWRRPILLTERALRRLLVQAGLEFVPPLLVNWLLRHAGCGPEYIGLRFPPSFGALVADIFGEMIGDYGSVSRGDPLNYVDSSYVLFFFYPFPFLSSSLPIFRGEGVGSQRFVIPTHRWDATVADRFVRVGSRADPRQKYSRWLLHGFVHTPSPEVLMRSWSTIDRLALAEHHGLYCAAFREEWGRNNRTTDTCPAEAIEKGTSATSVD